MNIALHIDNLYQLLKLRKFAFWGLYIFLFPFYFLPPGFLQVADFFLILFLVFNFKNLFTSVREYPFLKWLLLFVFYCFIVNFIWSLILDNFRLLKATFNYIYAVIIVIIFFNYLKDRVFLKYTFFVFTITLIVYFLISFQTIGNWGFRTTIFFNNPNQLALWSICSLIFIMSIGNYLKINFKILFALGLLCSYFSLLSISFSSIISLAVFWLYIFIVKTSISQKIFLLVLVFSVLFIKKDLIFSKDNIIVSNIIKRIETDSVDDNTLSGRGIDRVINNIEYTFFGAGEGIYDRFDSRLNGSELHSTFLSIFFSYGIIGLFFFFMYLFKIMIPYKTEAIILFLTISLFSLAHMVLRIPFVWLSFSILYLYKNTSEQ